MRKKKRPRIAVIDTGASSELSFSKDIIGGCSYFVQDKSIYMSYEWEDLLGHGSMVCSTIKRYCPNCLLYIVKIYDKECMTSSVLLLQALQHLLEVDVDFINISLAVSSNTYTVEIKEMLFKLYEQGKVVMASVKNRQTESFPANYKYCYGVKAVKVLPKYGYSFEKESTIQISADGFPEYVEELGRKKWFNGNSKATAKMTGFVSYYTNNDRDAVDIMATENSKQLLIKKVEQFLNEQGVEGYRHMKIIARGIELCRNYGEGNSLVRALKDVNIEIFEGEFVAVTGASGSGKTTLLNLLGGIDVPTSGSVCIGETSLENMKDDELAVFRREKIGFIFQRFNLLPIFTVYENIVMTVQIAGKKIDEDYVNHLINLLDLTGLEKRFPNQLSGGQQQRVAIARALASKPALILADEPTGNLDSQSGRDVVAFFRKAADELGQTIVMVTHNLDYTKMCDRIVTMKDGSIVKEGM